MIFVNAHVYDEYPGNVDVYDIKANAYAYVYETPLLDRKVDVHADDVHHEHVDGHVLILHVGAHENVAL